MERGCRIYEGCMDSMVSQLIKGYHVRSDEIEKETMRYMRVMWNIVGRQQRHERLSGNDR